MHSNPTIFNELKELQSPLADLPNINIFTVPGGYFEQLAPDILYAINNFQLIDEMSKSTGNMQVPDAYFDNLPAAIMQRIKAEGEDTEAVSFDSLKHINVFSVSAGYFDSIAGEVMQKIRSEVEAKNEETNFIDQVKPINVFSVPTGYFDSIVSDITQRIKTTAYTESDDTSFLDSVKHINVFSVPTGYFDVLANNIAGKIVQPAKVVVMQKRSSVFNYAVAAALTGLLGLSLFMGFNNKSVSITEKLFASTGINNNTSEEFDKAFEAISDDEIVHYLQDNGQDVNAALVASLTDDKDLPNEEEYYSDDKTLDKFLDELNIPQTVNAN